MAEAKIPENEEDRLCALYSYDLLDRDLDVVFNTIIKIAADICDTDICVIALIDRDRQYFLARKGMKPRETPRAIAFCAHAILAPDTIFEIYDATSDPRFLDKSVGHCVRYGRALVYLFLQSLERIRRLVHLAKPLKRHRNKRLLDERTARH